MIRTIKGLVTMTTESGIVVEVNGVGLEIHLPETSPLFAAVGQNVEVFTALQVKEDDLSLYGFQTAAELRFFRLLMTVSGIGPKAALAILSAVPLTEAIPAILRDDSAVFARANGIGKKSAQRITLELKDKLDNVPELAAYAYAAANGPAEGTALHTKNPTVEKAKNALIGLGLSQNEAADAAEAAYREGISTEDLILAALRQSR